MQLCFPTLGCSTLLKCTRLNKVFNSDLVGAYNILVTPITPGPRGVGATGPETRPGGLHSPRWGALTPNCPQMTYVTQNRWEEPPALEGETLPSKGREEVSPKLEHAIPYVFGFLATQTIVI